MIYIAGVDIGNNTTEVAVAQVFGKEDVRFLSSSMVRTVGIKGTLRNVMGVIDALDQALEPLGIARKQLDVVLLNEATPVIGDIAMETITETVITESAMIGHNPATPGGWGLAQGRTIRLEDLKTASAGGDSWVVVVPGTVEFEAVARQLNEATARGCKITAAIVQKDDGVLINNRLSSPIPIVDEVKFIDRVPVGMPAAVEVAQVGRTIEKLSNPYDIATLFQLDPDETRQVVPIARALMGTRSAVVIKTPKGDIEERRIPAGKIILIGHRQRVEVPVDEGADAIMAKAATVYPLEEVQAETGTNVGGMFEQVRQVMADLTDMPVSAVRVQDILAVDTFKPQQILGSLAGEYAMGNAVGLAAMVSTQKLPMQRLARKLEEEIGVRVVVGGVEADMAIRGALTTPGTRAPLAIVDVGGGSTDASLITEGREIHSTHHAGAGDMVTLLINTELGLENFDLAENIKRYPLARVESLFHMRHENGSVEFFREPLDPRLFGRTVVLTDSGAVPVESKELLAKIVAVRQQAKRKVFVRNTLRALERVAPAGNIRLVSFVALVGGSGLDFEIPKMISDALLEYGVVTGRANVRGTEGPRNAVATGLVLAFAQEYQG
ncbi:diol dehydratase reactivase subunit alpha [Telmatospirillum siberiense]|uniref:Diol dehydratase reactivase subunit alpha n=1 Tax=Telmatospirillum siberiense TaxID=382514 RepID=A0A2N3PUJ7_9PROT|nr:diol dehydratase reactivase subunit alpha [Telmatospirillum siberiense]PKU24075.1 diol dehydratase reactivase subunit alpha [Telmatospirillum siberiense]